MNQGDSYVPAFEIGEPLEGGCIGEVIESNNERFEVGEKVLGNLGWREYWKSDGKKVQKLDSELAPLQAYLGALGMTGISAGWDLNASPSCGQVVPCLYRPHRGQSDQWFARSLRPLDAR